MLAIRAVLQLTVIVRSAHRTNQAHLGSDVQRHRRESN